MEYLRFRPTNIGLSTEGLDKKDALNIYALDDLPSNALTEIRNQRKIVSDTYLETMLR